MSRGLWLSPKVLCMTLRLAAFGVVAAPLNLLALLQVVFDPLLQFAVALEQLEQFLKDRTLVDGTDTDE